VSPDVAGRIGSLAATYVVETKGTQGHHYTLEEFIERFDSEFPDLAGVTREALQSRIVRFAALGGE
jgi:hypothetical protein